ncbi:hypothetical protein SH1V18_38130 [Vallitalea longa]|uniref:Uncharacterized protein n=1 Tax=Vallitalea longa TaxID=2936439 RepID=A0A9W5YHJ7_9FIRM|nr:hypothetical protein [Vallitalea longa]GKX31333.1 hypothetical protein SH1V18_38130 [Vallitalea longa]
MKKYIKYILSSIVIILIILYINCFAPQNYSKVYNGIMYRAGNSKYEESITVKLEGQYNKNWFAKNKFKGTIYINDSKLPNVKIIWDKSGKGSIDYWINNYFYSYGLIYISKNLEKIIICVYETDNINKSTTHWNTVDGLIISAPANNRKEALIISNDLINQEQENNIVIY